MKKVPFYNLAPAHHAISKQLTQVFEETLASQRFIQGRRLVDFEQQLASYQGIAHAIGVSNGMDALTLAFSSLGLKQGDEVILSSHVYAACAMAITRLGATPVLVDPDPHTYLLDPQGLLQAITERTKGLLAVHLYGQPCAMDSIQAIATKADLWIVEDFAQAHGARYAGIRAGSFGHVNATSFYPTKILGALGDAGACTTDNQDLATRIRTLQNYGSSDKNLHSVQGFNMRLDELQAAWLSIKLPWVDRWVEERRALAGMYQSRLAQVGDLQLPSEAPKAYHAFHLFVVQTAHRNALRSFLEDRGIETMIHYPKPVHLQEAFAFLGYKAGSFPLAEQLANTLLSLPLWPGMCEEQVDQVCQAIQEFFS